MMLNLLEISLASGVPASLRNIPDKYNIIIRLWTNCFYRLLENLRRSSLSSKIALEYLQESMYHASTFYTVLLKRNTFEAYHAGWLEALGDLARYCIVIAAIIAAPSHGSSSLTTATVSSKIALEYLQEFIYHTYTFYTALLERNTFEAYHATGWLKVLGDLTRYRIVIAAMKPAPSHGSSSLTTAAVNGGLRTSPAESTVSFSGAMSTSSGEKHLARPDSPTPSVGIIAARLMELEPKKDCWRRITQDWYAKVVTEFPGRGNLHHHLGLLSCEVEGEELHVVHHFVKR